MEGSDFSNNEEVHLLFHSGVKVAVIGEMVLTLENTIEVFGIVAVPKERGAADKQRDNMVGVVLVVIEVRGGQHTEGKASRNEKNGRQISGAFKLDVGVVRLEINNGCG